MTTTGIGDMSHRSKRLAEKEASRDDDEGKTEDRRLSAGDVMGLTAPAGTPNLRMAQAVSEVDAAAVTLDSYNASGHGDDENTIDNEIDEKEGRKRRGRKEEKDDVEEEIQSAAAAAVQTTASVRPLQLE